MSLHKIVKDTKINFNNFFAFWIFNVMAGIWIMILAMDIHDSQHVSEIRTACQTVMVAVVFYYYGASQNSKKKDETIQQMLQQTGAKDEAIKGMVQDAKDLALDKPAPIVPPKVDVVIKNAGDDIPDKKDTDA